MSATQYNGTQPSKTAVDAAMHTAFEQEGYITDDGANDKTMMRERIFAAIIAGGKVLAKGERADKAITRGVLVAAVFPSLPGPEHIDEQSNPVATLVYREIDKLVWGETRTASTGPLQRLVGVNMGNGYILCRTKIGPNEIEAVYITDDIGCIRLDFTQPENESIARKLAVATQNREMLVLRQRHNAEKYAREYGRALNNALTAATGQLALAVQSATDNGGVEDEGGDED